LGGSVPLIPGVMQLTYVQNTGAAFSSFAGKTLLLGGFSALVSLVLIVVLTKGLIRHPYGRWPVALVLAGALGNMIDRLVLRYVTDMFQTLFMNFAVFNVADIFVVVGVILLALYVCFGWDKYEKPRKNPSAHQEEESE
jgi:signal peptidase II